MSDGRQRSAKRAWPSLPSVPFVPKTNRGGQSEREMQQMPTSATSRAPERKWINKQTERWGRTSGQREISAWRHSTDPTAGTDTLHNPGKRRPPSQETAAERERQEVDNISVSLSSKSN